MTSLQPDLAYTLADRLLAHIVQRLADRQDSVGKAFVCGEDAIPADDCCDGLVWTRVAQIEATDGSGATFQALLPAGNPVPGFVILLEAGAMRCAPTVAESGLAPTADEYTGSALQTASDRAAIRAALLCDLPADLVALNVDGQIPGPWLPIAQADCAGGYLTVQIVTTIVN